MVGRVTVTITVTTLACATLVAPSGCRQPTPGEECMENCPDAGTPDAQPAHEEEVARKQVDDSAALDLLFVVDNSGSMRDEQAALAATFYQLLEMNSVLDTVTSLHIGVTSTDLGAGEYGIEHCQSGGDGGNLLMPIDNCSYTNDGKPYITREIDADGQATVNYDGSLADAFACVARQGTSGCGFEQTLEAMRLALEDNPNNVGFVREDASLAVLIISDEDDCSVSDTAMFDISQDDIEAPLGNLNSFRCFEFGVVCDSDTPREPGMRADCQPRDDSPYMPAVSTYVDALRAAKPDPTRLSVGVISGPSDPVEVIRETQSGQPEADLNPACNYGETNAAPAVRLSAFARAFGTAAMQESICSAGYTDTLKHVVGRAATAAQRACLSGTIHDSDSSLTGVQAECTAALERDGESVQLPTCDTAAQETCYQVRGDIGCGDSGMVAELRPAAGATLGGAELVVTCLVE